MIFVLFSLTKNTGVFYNVYEEYNDHYIANNYDIDNKNVIVIKDFKIEAGEV